MHYFILACTILFSVAILLIFVVIILSTLKQFRRDGKLTDWNFLDYFSVGYLEHLYLKYIKRQ